MIIENIPYYETMSMIIEICGYILSAIAVYILFYLAFDNIKQKQSKKREGVFG